MIKVRRRKAGAYPVQPSKLTQAEYPNHVWTVDFKGWFLLGNGMRCDPLTVKDLKSHYMIGCRAMPSQQFGATWLGFKRMARMHGLPRIIRVDHGTPFSAYGLGRLSRLSIWWIEQGIAVEFTRPASPQDNGSHERMHRADDLDVRNVLIMVDMWGDHGTLASALASKRKIAADNHRKWVDAAKFLGCHAIRVNAHGYEAASYEDARDYFVDGLSQLVEYGASVGIRIVVENHGGYSSNGQWLVEVMQGVGSDYCGTLPDFGNFRIDGDKGIFYDPLQGMKELMPYAKGVSAKANNFDANGVETTMDFPEMLKIVQESDFEGYIGIEWGGGSNPTMIAEEGIRATQAALDKYLLA